MTNLVNTETLFWLYATVLVREAHERIPNPHMRGRTRNDEAFRRIFRGLTEHMQA